MSHDLGSLTSSISIVLGILTYFLTMLYAAASQLLEKPIPSVDQADARKKLRQALAALLFLAELPLFVSFGVLFFICLPATVTVLETSTFRIWDFDVQETLFVFLELGVAASLCIVGWLGIRLLNKRCGTFST
jgi:hypothetical protein